MVKHKEASIWITYTLIKCCNLLLNEFERLVWNAVFDCVVVSVEYSKNWRIWRYASLGW